MKTTGAEMPTTAATDHVMLPASAVLMGDILHLDGQAALRVDAVGLRDCHGIITVRGEGRSIGLRADRKVEVERAVDASGQVIGLDEEV